MTTSGPDRPVVPALPTTRSVPRNDLSPERFELALRAGGMGTWRWDIPAGVVDWDYSQQELFGFTPGTFPGTYEAYASRLHPEDRLRQREALAAVLDGESDQFRIEHRLLLPDGTIRWIRSVAQLRRTPGGQPAELIGVSVDITDRRSAEIAEQDAREEAEASHRRLALLAQLSQLLVAPLDVGVTLCHVADLAVRDFADWCVVDLLDRDSVRRVAITHRDPTLAPVAAEVARLFRPEDTAPRVRAVVRNLEPRFTARITPELLAESTSDPGYRELLTQLNLSSAVIVPLVAKGVGIGALTLVRSNQRTFSVQDVALAAELGRRAGSAAEKARLYTEQDRVVRILQRSLQPPDLPEVPGMELGAYYRPWTAGLDVGGDFYDVFHNGASWWLVLGDVCGKGPAAAAVGTAVRHILRALLVDDTDPEQALQRLNTVLGSSMDEDTYTTTVVVRLTRHGDGALLRVATGGHLPPLVRRRDGTVTEIPVRGTLLGLLPQVQVGQAEVRLAPGDTLLLYTDGVTEATLGTGIELGQDAVRALLARTPDDDAQHLVDSLAKEVLATAETVRDDVAMLALRVPVLS
jgi:PAS domain S-box-containing protein